MNLEKNTVFYKWKNNQFFRYYKYGIT
jgi:hypothetical protein